MICPIINCLTETFIGVCGDDRDSYQYLAGHTMLYLYTLPITGSPVTGRVDSDWQDVQILR